MSEPRPALALSLDELGKDPERVRTLTAQQVAAALACLHVAQARLAATEGVLVSRLLTLQAQPTPSEDALIDMATAARLLGVPESKAREMGRRGQLPTVAIGRYVRVSRRTLEAVMAGRPRRP